MSRIFQLLVVAYLVCSTAVILLHLETALGLMLGILGLILVVQILKRWSEEYGRRCDPNFDKIYAAQSRKWQQCIMAILSCLVTVYLFPVSD